MSASDPDAGIAAHAGSGLAASAWQVLISVAGSGCRALLWPPLKGSAPAGVLLAFCGAALLAGPVIAQEDKRLMHARESLRRAQTALQAAQQEKLGLQRDKAALEQERNGLEQAIAAAQKAEKVAAGQRQRLEVEIRRVGAERDRLLAEMETLRGDRAVMVDQLASSQRQLASSALARDEQRRLNAALLELLERSVATLSAAEAKNRELYRLGYQVLEAWRHATPEAQRAQSEPLLGIASVRMEDEAEALRRLLDAQRTAASR
jgi:chromosome segregation ATPase